MLYNIIRKNCVFDFQDKKIRCLLEQRTDHALYLPRSIYKIRQHSRLIFRNINLQKLSGFLASGCSQSLCLLYAFSSCCGFLKSKASGCMEGLPDFLTGLLPTPVSMGSRGDTGSLQSSVGFLTLRVPTIRGLTTMDKTLHYSNILRSLRPQGIGLRGFKDPEEKTNSKINQCLINEGKKQVKNSRDILPIHNF